MRLKKYLISILVICFMFTFCINAFADINDGLVAYYPFNGNSNDESGNGNHGTVYEATLTTDRDGTASSAYHFDGIDDYIDIPYSPSIEPSIFTLVAWIKTTMTSIGPIFSTDPAALHGHHGYMLWIYYDDIPVTFWVDHSTSPGFTPSVSSNSIVNDDIWHQLIAIYDGTSLMLYRDGILENTTLGQGYAKTNQSIRVGMERSFDPEKRYFFSGSIDDIRIYNRALSEEEIRELFGESLGKSCSKCGTGSHWVDTCSVGGDQVTNQAATVGIDLNLDCVTDVSLLLNPCGSPDDLLVVDRSDPLDDSANFPGLRPIDGHLDVIDTEIISMCLTGSGITLKGGLGQGAVISPSLGAIAEQASDSTLADSFFNVFFEVDLGGGQFVYNQTPLSIESEIDCVPPQADYIHPPAGCLPLYTDPNPGQGMHVANLVEAEHWVNPDADEDGVGDNQDNCIEIPNGPDLGTCTSSTIGDLCTIPGLNESECGAGGFCSMDQEDTYPPQGNGIGDACDCEGNFDCDEDVDGTNAATFKADFGRSSFTNPCESGDPCNGDFDCDGDVDGTDAALFKSDFGRSSFNNPCPACVVGDWCVYE